MPDSPVAYEPLLMDWYASNGEHLHGASLEKVNIKKCLSIKVQSMDIGIR